MAELSYDTLEILRGEHLGWRLLRSDHAPLVVSFLNRVFVVPNVRILSESVLAEALEDDLFVLRERLGDDTFPRSGREYLADWASPGKGWLRRFYPQGMDEAHYELVPASERMIAWLGDLEARAFVGTESRLLTLFEHLRQMATGSLTDPEIRVAELQKRRDAIDEEIRHTLEGSPTLLNDTAMRDRFQQFTQMARELLSDFREVEQNFRNLDRSVRERIALWEEGKAALLDEVMGRRDAIDDSDQGRSFRAFWDFLMSDRRQQELTELLDTILDHPAIATDEPDPRLRRIHYEWIKAGDHTQRTVADLSAQLRRFLDDQAWLENLRIMDLLRGIEAKSLGIRPEIPGAVVFMALGYGVESLGRLPWVEKARCFYFGDLDSHGFAILNRARAYIPKLCSLLMDEKTLLIHRDLWGEEEKPCRVETLPLLTPEEQAVYRGIRHHQWKQNLRLEQERLDWDYVTKAIATAIV